MSDDMRPGDGVNKAGDVPPDQGLVIPNSSRNSSATGWVVGWVIAGVLVPGIVLAVIVWRNAVDVPYYDEWALTSVISKSIHGTLRFDDFFAQHSAHRLIFPKLILLGLARFTGWDTRYELAVNVFLGFIQAIVIALAAWRMSKLCRETACALVIPLYTMMVLSLSQFENWMWGWQCQILLMSLTASSALFLLTSAQLGYGRLIAAAVMSVIATFSFANGMLVWPLGLVVLVYPGLRDSPRRWIFVALWAIAAAAVLILYFHDFSMPARDENAASETTSPLAFAQYFCAFLGAPVAYFDLGAATFVGAIGLGLSCLIAVYVVASRSIPPSLYLPGAILWLFSLGSALFTTYGRAEFGPIHALQSRYLTLSNPFWIGAFMMFAAAAYAPGGVGRSINLTQAVRAVFLVLVGLTAVVTVYADVSVVEPIRQFSHRERVLRFKLLTGHLDDQMLALAADLKQIKRGIEMAKRDHFWAWRPGAPASMFEMPPLHYRTDGNDPESEFRRGDEYFQGVGGTPDYPKAFAAWSKAAEQGHGPAQYNLGLMFEQGMGVAPDRQKAIEWYAKAATSGLANAQFRLGAIYAKGETVPRDYSKTFELWSQAAAQGHAAAELNLGVMYATGTGVARDDAKAVMLYAKAAAQGLADAQFAYGEALAGGMGVARDDIEAYVWLDAAAAAGHVRAAGRRDEIAAGMSAEQLADAQRSSLAQRVTPDDVDHLSGARAP